MMAASSIREVTKPSAAGSFCPDHREQRHSGADAGQGVDQVEEAAPQHACVGAGAGDVAGVVQHRGEQEHGGDRGSEGDQIEQARDERDASG
jgi:hypothetical protein